MTHATVDVARRGAADEWIAGVVRDHGRLDGAVNLAGVSGRKFVLMGEMGDEEWDAVMGINCYGVYVFPLPSFFPFEIELNFSLFLVRAS